MERIARALVSSEPVTDPRQLAHGLEISGSSLDRSLSRDVEQRLLDEVAQLRCELEDLASELHRELRKLRGDVRTDVAADNTDLMKWTLVCWVGQAVAVAAIVAALR